MKNIFIIIIVISLFKSKYKHIFKINYRFTLMRNILKEIHDLEDNVLDFQENINKKIFKIDELYQNYKLVNLSLNNLMIDKLNKE